jgi:hypothetical protein
MSSDHPVFGGVEIVSGRKPVIFAVLDTDLHIQTLEKQSVADPIHCLNDYENMLLVINLPAQKSVVNTFADLKKKISHARFNQFSKNQPRSWLEAEPQKSFLALGGDQLLPRRTLEGRIQRALILYEEGLQIPDPMDFFEEVTRHRLLQGSLPTENLYSAPELDALIAACLAWMVFNEPRQVHIMGNMVSPLREKESE